MIFPAIALFGLFPIALAAPKYVVEEHQVLEVHQKRQADIGQLLQLASLAGISALPTNNPALLLSLGPLANSLASELPTPSVLSVLLTAAPSGFVSSIVNDPSFASSFESAFEAGSSPGWFNSLPTDVRSYLHTYSGFAAVATAAEGVKSQASETATGSGVSGSTGSATAAKTASTTTTGSSVASMTSTATSVQGASSSSAASEAATTARSSSSAGGAASAAQPTGVIIAGMAAIAGLCNLAAWLP